MERLEELFLKLSGEKEIVYNTGFGEWWRGADAIGIVGDVGENHQYWEALLVREMTLEQRRQVNRNEKKSSEISPEDKIKSLKFATVIAERDGTSVVDTTTKLNNYATETIDEMINNAIRFQRILGTFLKDNVEKVTSYLNPGFPMSYSRTVIPIEGEYFPLTLNPSEPLKIKFSKYLQDNAAYGGGPHFEASARSIPELKTILRLLNYHRGKLEAALQ